MHYKEALDYMFSRLPMFQRIGPAAYKADLSNTIALCKAVGDPQDTYPGIHIAGTNGKGSVASLIAASLQESGYTTGLFTSPHLVDYRERIRINGQMVDKDFVCRFISEHQGLFDDLRPSFFEMSYALAASWFREKDVDIVVWETGMGGRLDSTNVITPILSVITNIGLDHTQFLGTTIGSIAKEKAGIIKPGVPVLVGRRQQETIRVFSDQARSCNSDLVFAEDFIHLETQPHHPLDEILTIKVGADGEDWLPGLECSLTGSYQVENIRTALGALLLLKKLGYSLRDESILVGFRNVRKMTGIAGRWLRLNDSPPAYCDTGHNSDGFREIAGMLTRIKYNRLIIIFGTVADKDSSDLLPLLPKEAQYLLCRAKVPRAMPVDELARLFEEQGLRTRETESCAMAYRQALEHAGPDDFIFVGGSTFVVAEVLKGIKAGN